MGQIPLRYYTTRTYGGRKFGYWQPTPRMKEQGFSLVSCGPDGPEAWTKAAACNARWDAWRTKGERQKWPAGSVGAAYEAYRGSKTWAEKKARTREDWERGWRYIEHDFGDVKPSTVTFPMIDDWYADLLKEAGVREAFRAMKIWRALYKVAAAMKFCKAGEDPSQGVRRKTPKVGTGIWREGEVVIRVKTAIRGGYLGLACCIAVAWDAALSPVDTRKLTFGNMEDEGPGALRFSIDRAKTGRAAIATVSPRTERLLRAYLATLPPNQVPAAAIFRNRSGRAYSKDTLGDDFRDIRGEGETRTIAMMRRSAAVEAMNGGANAAAMSAKLANQLSTNEELHKAYNPVDLGAVQLVDSARLVGRRKGRKSH